MTNFQWNTAARLMAAFFQFRGDPGRGGRKAYTGEDLVVIRRKNGVGRPADYAWSPGVKYEAWDKQARHVNAMALKSRCYQ